MSRIVGLLKVLLGERARAVIGWRLGHCRRETRSRLCPSAGSAGNLCSVSRRYIINTRMHDGTLIQTTTRCQSPHPMVELQRVVVVETKDGKRLCRQLRAIKAVRIDR